MSNPKMIFLRLFTNKITKVDESLLNKMTKLRFLSIGENVLEGALPAFAGLTSLEELYLDCNKYSGTVPAMFGTKKLKTCFLDADPAKKEKCATPYDNTFDCPLPAGAAENCHAVCK
jgi:hypothetical protein